MVTVGIYTRLSQDRDGKAESPQRQERACRELADQRGWKVDNVFTDRDLSAYTGKLRPGFEAMLAAVEAGQLDGVVAFKLDRLVRNRRDYFRLTELVEGGMLLAAVADPVDTSTPMGGVVLDLLASIARAESATISTRVRSAFDDRAREGKPHTSGGRTFGYDEQHRIVAREAEAIGRAVELVLSGGTLGQVARELNAAGITTSRGNTWTSVQVGRMLRLPTIAGLRSHHGALYRGTWDPIVDEDTWRRVKATLDARKGTGTGRRANLLTGLARCGRCDRTLVVGRSGKGVRRYLCHLKGGCGRLGIMADGLDTFVVDHVLTALDGPGLRKALRAVEAGTKAKGAAATQRELVEAEADLKQLSHDHHVLKLVPRAAYMDAARELTARVERLTAALAVDTDRAVLASLPQADVRGWWDRADLEARRAVLDAVLSSVVVGPVLRGGAGWDPDRVTLVWRA